MYCTRTTDKIWAALPRTSPQMHLLPTYFYKKFDVRTCVHQVPTEVTPMYPNKFKPSDPTQPPHMQPVPPASSSLGERKDPTINPDGQKLTTPTQSNNKLGMRPCVLGGDKSAK